MDKEFGHKVLLQNKRDDFYIIMGGVHYMYKKQQNFSWDAES